MRRSILYERPGALAEWPDYISRPGAAPRGLMGRSRARRLASVYSKGSLQRLSILPMGLTRSARAPQRRLMVRRA